MTMIGATFVPADTGHPYNENCHAFVCRYLSAAHRLPPNTLPSSPQNARALLWGAHTGAPARVNGELRTEPGDIIGFWIHGQLMHSMVAVTKALWIGANNTTCMGVAGGRVTIVHSVAGGYFEPGRSRPVPVPPTPPAGWVGAGNHWRYAMGGELATVTRRSP